MAALQKKSFNQPDQSQKYEKGKAEIITAGGLTFEKVTTEPGWQWSKHRKPLVKTESCQNPHLIYVISGTLHVKMDDGKEDEFSAGDIGILPPGHDAWTIGNEPAVVLEIVH